MPQTERRHRCRPARVVDNFPASRRTMTQSAYRSRPIPTKIPTRNIGKRQGPMHAKRIGPITGNTRMPDMPPETQAGNSVLPVADSESPQHTTLRTACTSLGPDLPLARALVGACHRPDIIKTYSITTSGASACTESPSATSTPATRPA